VGVYRRGCSFLYRRLVALYFLTDGPAQAGWLNADEKRLVRGSSRRRRSRSDPAPASTGSLTHFATRLCGFSAWCFWIRCRQLWHQLLAAAGHQGDPRQEPSCNRLDLGDSLRRVGGCNDLAGHHSDLTGERRWHIALAAFWERGFRRQRDSGHLGSGRLGRPHAGNHGHYDRGLPVLDAAHGAALRYRSRGGHRVINSWAISRVT